MSYNRIRAYAHLRIYRKNARKRLFRVYMQIEEFVTEQRRSRSLVITEKLNEIILVLEAARRGYFFYRVIGVDQ